MLKISTRRLDDDFLIYDLVGGLEDDGDVEKLRRFLQANGARRSLINLKEVTYISHLGLGLLVSRLVLSLMNGGRFKLCSPTGRVNDLLKFMKPHLCFEVFDKETDAVASFQQ